MPIPIFQVDAFTGELFHGNPAAVCLLDGPRDAAWMQHVATEMNLAETAFLEPKGDEFNLRWFSPAVEVDLCGHATLASAHVLWQTKRLAPDRPARFHTKSGLLQCTRQDDWIEMDFPATPGLKTEPPKGLLDALGVADAVVAQSKFDYLVELTSEQKVRALVPDLAALKRIKTRGVIVTARGSGEFDFISRFFAPQVGIDEDPVTGSAYCCLGPWWRGRVGKDQMLAVQASKRGGTIRVTLKGDRVLLGGQAVTILRGELIV